MSLLLLFSIGWINLKKLKINEKGEWLDPWPSGFFDESFDEIFD